MASKQLVLLRHAKSSWDDADLDDFDRPLAPLGERAATRMGRYLREHDVIPELVLCSSAVRTRQTLERLELPEATRIEVVDDLYGAPPVVVLDRVRHVDDHIASVMVIAHNPGLHETVASLVDRRSDAPAEFPTAALAVLRLPIERWLDLTSGIGRLVDFMVPRSLK